MSSRTKLILTLLPYAALAFFLISVLILQERQRDQIADLEVSHKNLTSSLQRAETERAKEISELYNFAKENGYSLDEIKSDLYQLHAQLEAVATTEAKTTTVINKNYYSDNSQTTNPAVPQCPEDGRPIDVHGYTKRAETKYLHDSNGMRVADVTFEAALDRPWTTKVYGIRYKILNTVGRTKTGQIILHTELLSENPEAEPGKTYRVDAVTSKVIQAPREPTRFDWWDPKLYLAGLAGIQAYPEVDFSASLGLGFSIFSYGEDWRFLGITVAWDAYQNTFRASLVPVLYNLGGPLPFFSDLLLFLDIGADSSASVSVSLGIATTL
jgi:hypothetical protein